MVILFVDDDDFMTKPMREKLQRIEGHEVDYVKDPVKALDKYKSNPGRFEVIILDIMMPHCDVPEYKDFSIPKYFLSNASGRFTGLKLLLQIRDIMGKEKEPVKTPIIILTAINHRDIDNYLKEMKVSVNEVVNKPIIPTEFVKILNEIVSPKK